MKKMRQNYGTDWLLSSSSLLEKPPTTDTSQHSSKAMSSSSITEIVSSSEGRPSNNTKASSDDDDSTRIGNIIESFAVYRSIEFSVLDLASAKTNDDQEENNINNGDEVDEDATRTVCIFSIGERCLVEKDEANSTVFCVNEIANLSDIKLATDSKFVSYLTYSTSNNLLLLLMKYIPF